MFQNRRHPRSRVLWVTMSPRHAIATSRIRSSFGSRKLALRRGTRESRFETLKTSQESRRRALESSQGSSAHASVHSRIRAPGRTICCSADFQSRHSKENMRGPSLKTRAGNQNVRIQGRRAWSFNWCQPGSKAVRTSWPVKTWTALGSMQASRDPNLS